MPYANKQTMLEYQRRWNKKYYKENTDAEKKRIFGRRKEIAEWLTEYKSHLECIKCGERTTVCLDFHHIDQSTKDRSVALSIRWGWGKERIKKEIQKCIVLCSNCHRKLHAGLIKI
jgi:transcription elongation factor Elf1